jgi:acyl-CoA hydrolase
LSCSVQTVSRSPKGQQAIATYEESPTSASPASESFAALPDDETVAETVVGLKEHGFSVEVVDDLDAARRAVLARIPEGSSVMTNPSVTLEETGIAQAIDDGGPYDSGRSRALGLDHVSQLREIKAIMVQPDFTLGSVHAITRDGTLVIASALGSQLASYTWGADKVIFVVGAQKLVPDLAVAHERIHEHCLELEDARALEAYGKPSRVGKILEIHQEDPGRIHVVLIQRQVGF